MKRIRKRASGMLDSGEGFIDVLFLLLTFFIIQNVWQIHMAEIHNRFLHAQKLDFVKAPKEDTPTAKLRDRNFIQIIIGKEFVLLEKGGLINEERYVFQEDAHVDVSGIERIIMSKMSRALTDLVGQKGIPPEKIVTRLYFQRGATVTYTVGVYEALNTIGIKTVHWGLESQKDRL